MKEEVCVEQNSKPERLGYLGFLKFVAMALIVLWHVVTLPSKPFDIGARMCEFLIVASGFLVGYNHFYKPMPCTFKESFKYLYKHLRTFYPLHIICLVLLFFLNFTNNINSFNVSSVENLIANIFLVQAYSPLESTVFSFNGISWFLSALVLCYFLSPLFLRFVRNIKISVITFAVVLTIRLLIEYFVVWGSGNIYGIWFHANPIIKAMEFFLGMLIIPAFFALRRKIETVGNKTFFKILWTIVELTLPVCMWFFMYNLSSYLIRGVFILFFCLCVFASSINKGYFSKFFNLKIPSRILSYQLGAFLLQIVIDYVLIKVLRLFGWKYPDNYFVEYLIVLSVDISVAALYHEFLLKPLAKLMDKSSTFLIKLLKF